MAAIEAARPAEGYPHYAGGQAKSTESWFVLAFGLLLLIISIPRFTASMYAVPGDYVVWLIAEGKTPDRGKLDILWKSSKYAAGLVDSEKYWSQMALAGVAMGNHAGWKGEGGRGLLERTLHAQERGLSLSPVSPYSWLRYSYLASAAGGNAAAAEALAMSYRTGPAVDGIAEERLRLAARLWPNLGEEVRGKALAEARYLWLKNPGRFARMAAGNVILSEMVLKSSGNLE